MCKICCQSIALYLNFSLQHKEKLKKKTKRDVVLWRIINSLCLKGALNLSILKPTLTCDVGGIYRLKNDDIYRREVF